MPKNSSILEDPRISHGKWTPVKLELAYIDLPTKISQEEILLECERISRLNYHGEYISGRKNITLMDIKKSPLFKRILPPCELLSVLKSNAGHIFYPFF